MKGERIALYSQASSDWWRGREGLVPDKYIHIRCGQLLSRTLYCEN